ncbi:MAG: preQ(1) synthase [Verrucomicrobiaceae bacterium]|nr:preQ(1) synthase [Verrucomicrobiaceae bacterium]
MGDILLGKSVDYDAPYDPGLLSPIARAAGRDVLAIGSALPFGGCDIWNAYELSWLDSSGKPQVAIGEFRFPAMSPNIVESKSFKLYLNSLNQHRFAEVSDVALTMQRDLAVCVGAPVEILLHLPQQWSRLQTVAPRGHCLDAIAVAIDTYTPAPELLTINSQKHVSQSWFSRLLRSRCPVTGQPDWGTVQIEYRGAEIDPAGLLAYIVSFREHQDFHEHCVERMFVDIMQRCAPQQLTVYARYLRRGGLDINPYRSTELQVPANARFARQ